MTDTRSQQIATLQQEISALQSAISMFDKQPAVQAPLQVQLAEKQRQLAALTGQPAPAAGTITTYQSGGINFGSGNSIGTIGDIVAGDKIGGDKVMGDKVAGDRITVGDISGSSGIAIGRNAGAHVVHGAPPAGGPLGDATRALFQRVYRQIEALPEEGDIQDELANHVRQIEQEAARGTAADEAKIESRLTLLARLEPDIFNATVAALQAHIRSR
jgi:hypothetical protein